MIFLTQTGSLTLNHFFVVSGLHLFLYTEGRNPQQNRSHSLTVTSSGSVGYWASWPHCKNNRDPPLCPRSPSLRSDRPSLHPSPFVCPSPPADSPSPHRLRLHPASRVRMCLCVSARLFACTPATSLCVCMSAPETPAPPRWAWSHGPARRTRQPLRTHTARQSHPPRSRSRSSTPTNSAWTRSGVRWRPSGRGVVTQSSTAPGGIPDSQKVNFSAVHASLMYRGKMERAHREKASQAHVTEF